MLNDVQLETSVVDQRNGLNEVGYEGWLWLEAALTVDGLLDMGRPETDDDGWLNGFGVGVTDGEGWRFGDVNGLPVPVTNSIWMLAYKQISDTLLLLDYIKTHNL